MPETIADAIAPEIAARAIEIRRDIHRFPELGFEEERTAGIIEAELSALAIEHRRIAKTGVVGVIRGALPGKVAALRADMDALPVTERSGEPFSSEVGGKMHACGHDAHTAMLLGAARVLQSSRHRLEGSVVLLFQPAEEGPGGALPMIEAGAMDDPKVDAVAMLHVDYRLPTGSIGFTPGVCNAAADEFYITVEGKGGHGSAPHTTLDTIPCAAAMVLALQNIAARETDPFKSVVVTVGTIEGGYRNNIIADRVKMSGTFRSQDPQIREALEGRARRILDGIASAYQTTVDLKVIYGYPPVYNDPTLVTTFERYLGERYEQLKFQVPAMSMGGEDFAYFAQRVPGVLVRLGIYNEARGSVHPAHSPQFRVDEDALAHGIETLVAFARGVGSGRVGGGASDDRRSAHSGDRRKS